MGLKIIKAIKVKENKILINIKNLSTADLILFDTPGYGKIYRISKKFNS